MRYSRSLLFILHIIVGLCGLKQSPAGKKKQSVSYWESKAKGPKLAMPKGGRIPFKGLCNSRGRRNWEIGINIYALLILCRKEITNGNPMYSSGNPTPRIVVT